MDASPLLINLSAPPFLFFLLGVTAALIKSDLELPTPVVKFLSLYLLFAIGFKGGSALASSTLDAESWKVLGTAVALACTLPIVVFYFLKRWLDVANRAAIAATYGSVSAVTFATATAYLDSQGIPWGGHLVAAMALMESPAIIVGVLLFRSHAHTGAEQLRIGQVIRDACFGGPVLLILGSLVIGLIAGARGAATLAPITQALFPGLLCFFLLDMGIVAARRLQDLKRIGAVLPLFALTFPIVIGCATALMTTLAGFAQGDSVLLAVLAGSASYIAVPASMRLALPQANPGLYVPLAIGITFPFNIAFGIPIFHSIVVRFG